MGVSQARPQRAPQASAERTHRETAKAQIGMAGGWLRKECHVGWGRLLASQKAHGHFRETDTQTAGGVKTLTPGLTDGSGR